jgi:hypothetical protein
MMMILTHILLATIYVSLHAQEALKWNVTVSTPVKKGNKSILLNVCGQASKGKLHAIMVVHHSSLETIIPSLLLISYVLGSIRIR